MSEDAPEAPSPLAGFHRRVAIVASLYNDKYVDSMLRATQSELEKLLPEGSFPLFRVPGAYEVPVCTSYVAQHTGADAIICLGVIIKGETAHADLVADSVTSSLQSIALDHTLPIIHEVLLLNDEDQAQERCCGSRSNRGVEAARAAVNMLELFHKLNTNYPPTTNHGETRA